MTTFETRFVSDLRATDEGRLVGYAAVYGARSHDLGGFIEVIAPGAFTRSLREFPDVQALYEHNPEKLLARTTNGTLRIQDDARGLRVEIDPADTSYARDLVALVRGEFIGGMSFRFRPFEGGDSWDYRAAPLPLRTLHSVQLAEVSVVAKPAYPDTSVAVRDLERARAEHLRQTLRRMRLRLASI